MIVAVAAGVNAGVEVSEFHGVLSVVEGMCWERNEVFREVYQRASTS